MSLERATDRRLLRESAYADGAKLRARGSIYRYRVPPVPIGEWVLELVAWPAGVRVLDVGCGAGPYLALLAEAHPALQLIGVDLSAGMLGEATAAAPTAALANADSAALPLRDATFDRVLAPHMLYHCPDIAAAARELRRVLAPDGVLVAVTNARDHLAELRDLTFDVTGQRTVVSDRFDLDTGLAPLRTSFERVEVHHYTGEVVIPEAGPVMAYLASMVDFWGYDDAADLLAELRHRVDAVIARDGAFRARTHSGAFVCR